MLKTIEWTGSACRLLDQTKLPTETCYVDITDEKQMWDAIRRLVVRGAPAIGVAAAFGVYLGVASPTSPSGRGRPEGAGEGRRQSGSLLDRTAVDRGRDATRHPPSPQPSPGGRGSHSDAAVDDSGPTLLPFYTRLNEVCDYLATSRPTAVNLFWAIDRMRRAARDAGRAVPLDAEDADAIAVIRARLLATGKQMLEDDTTICRKLGEHGLEVLQSLKT